MIEVFHVVTEHPMAVGDCIRFDEQHRSGVYDRVMAKQDVVKEILANPAAYEGKQLDHPTDVALRELAMEEVRQKEFPNYPSRMACLYVSETLEEAKQWADYFIKLGRPTYSIVRMEVSGCSFIGDACNCFDGTPCQEDNLRHARHYWLNLPNGEGPAIREMLVDGEIRVAEIIQAFDQ